MSEYGVYLLPQGLQQADAEWPVLLWSDDGQVHRSRLSSLRDVVGGAGVVVVAPMEMLGCCEADPVPGRRPSREALTYALEDQLAAPLERLHLAFGTADSEGRRRALVIDRERFASLLALLQASGIDPLAVQADADRLFGEAGALWLEGRWLIGGARLPLLALPGAGARTLATVLEPMPWMAEAPQAEEQPCNQRVSSAAALLVAGRRGAIDLRQGEFRRRHAGLPWRSLTAALAGIWLSICVADQVRLAWLEQRIDAVHVANLQHFQRWAPGQPVAGDLATLVEALEQRRPPSTAMQRLAVLGEQLVQAGNLQLERAELGGERHWRVEVSGQRFADLERLRQQLPELDIGQARQDEQGVLANLIWTGGE